MQTLIKYFILFNILLPLIALSQKPYSISGTIKNCKQDKIIFSKIYGKEVIAVDSVILQNDCTFRFNFPDSQYVGVFRLSFNNVNNADFIFNKENIYIENDYNNFSENMKIIESEENKILYEYNKSVGVIKDSIKILTTIGQNLYEKDRDENSVQLKKIVNQIDLFEKQKNDIGNNLILKFPKSFASKIIKASFMPDFNLYQKKQNAAHYPNEAEFLKEHFFDNIDFADSNLLHTNIIFKKCGEYINYYASPTSVETYKKAIDYILVRTAVNKNVNDYILKTMMITFEHSDWEEVYSYVVEKYLAQNYCESDTKAKQLSQKINTIKTLKSGNKAPNIATYKINEKAIVLDSINSPYLLLFFWKSSCEFCEKEIPELANIYNNYKSKGLEIFAVSLDSIKQNWIDATTRFSFPWINTCDLKGLNSPIVKDYNIWRTPTFYLLDKNKKIIARPANTSMLKEKLKEIK
ncbi:MAG: redoxin domain-containing protein [Bacteroidetes bacterium]|nr:redoxin domain-containing protein [Bacteroidota bacterium]